MKKCIVSLFTVLAALMVTCSLVAAAAHMKSESAGQGQMEQMEAGASPSADELLGMEVISSDGEELGSIEDVKLDTESGRIAYVTLSRGGIMGMGAESIAVPLAAFRFDTEMNQATLLVDRGKLDNVPEQAGLSDAEFEQKLQSHYGISPAWKQEQMMDEPSGMMDEPSGMMEESSEMMEESSEMMEESSGMMEEKMEPMEQKKKSMY